jgi:two-component system response regulator (stage 0 sporulation protein A)
MNIRLGIAEGYPSMVDIYQLYFDELENVDLIWVSKNGSDTIENIKRQDIDILILDIILPQVSGLDILKWLKDADLEKKPKVIVCSVLSNENIIQQALDYGAYYFFVKPFEFSKLTEKINELTQ